ncbi:MAG TPA: phosphatidylglycerol lysyltransferase domain-containing protein [Candidatus Saccharimonadales bacterium]|nr:phosphatidylglycerol lysyltransferase domain-containing protein [Candidatus Saccharimonadales bacterium]
MADTNSQPRDEAVAAFKVFPQFSKLTFSDRNRYQALVANYPPIANISFPNLMTWWNTLNGVSVSLLEDNLVISYWAPGMEELSGLSLVGVNNVDQVLCTIFDHLAQRGEQARIVHVPEFVIEHMHHPELFSFHEERRMDEYIYVLSKFFPSHRIVDFRQRHIKKFLAAIDEEQISVRSLELGEKQNRRLLLDSVGNWKRPGVINNFARHNDEALRIAITRAEELGLDNICLFINGQLHGYVLYHVPTDKRYVVMIYARINNELPHTFDYTAYRFAKWFLEQGFSYINLESDLGLPLLRTIKLALGPTNFFRLYTVKPAV